jgi:8-oxo-dGTP pyrophosphatase MutT (NUDIX family)
VAERNGPWTVHASDVVYENAWIRVRHDTVTTPSGTEGIYGVVETRPALGVVALTADLRTYLVGQHRYPHRTYTWEIPEGAGRNDEDLLAGARRELREETGLSAARWTALGTIQTSNCITDEVAYLFLAEDLTEGEPAPDETEELEVRVVAFDDAMAMVRSGAIQDAMSVVALYRAAELLEDRETTGIGDAGSASAIASAAESVAPSE